MRKLIIEAAKRANKKLVDKIARRREIKAGVNPADPKTKSTRAKIRRGAQETAKNVYKGAAATGLGGVVGAEVALINKVLKSDKSKPPSTTTTAETKPKTKPKSKPFDVAGLRSAYNKASTPKVKKPLGPVNKPKAKKKVVGKTVKMASVPTIRSPKSRTPGPKTKVPVGSSVIRNRDGSIKKIKKPSGKPRKNKFERMTRSQINRLSGKEAADYRRYKREKGKK